MMPLMIILSVYLCSCIIDAAATMQSETLAAALAAATGGVWEGGKHGGLRLKTGAAAARPITVSAGEIRVVLPGRYGPALILGGGL